MSAKAVVVIGGGAGTDLMLRGLKRYTGRLTALLSTFDASHHGPEWAADGASRSADGVRSSLLALGADSATTQIMERLFAYRVPAIEESVSRSFGTLFLSALTDITGAADLALQAAAQVLNVQGRVLPLTLAASPLLAELQDGREVLVHTPDELVAAVGQTGLREVRLPAPMPVLGTALDIIADADIIVLGPADLFFNVLAPLQLAGLREAIAESSAVKIFICNLMTQPQITHDWPASRFIRRALEYLGGPGSIDYAIVSSSPLDPDALVQAAAAGAFPVRLDLEECLSLGLNIIARPVTAPDSLRHDSEKLARTILFLGGERVHRRAERPAMPAATLDSVLPARAWSTSGAEP
jgi:uncharacterized cofD-like protein